MKSHLIMGIGVIIFAFGALFTLQGMGVVAWPRESFMIGQSVWTERGLVVALMGIALMLTAWRIRRK